MFLKTDLVNDHYTWVDAANETTYMGEPSRRLFDRFNGNQVLLIINFLGKTIGTLKPGDSSRLEELILNRLPDEAKSELSVYNWLRSAYVNE